MSQRKLKSSIKVLPTIPELGTNDKWTAFLPTVTSHIKNQDVQGITLMEPYVTPTYSGEYEVGRTSKLEAITDRINDCIDHFMTTDATHIWLVDGDVQVPKHAFRYLLELDVDIASGIYPFHNQKYAMMFGRMKNSDDERFDKISRTHKFTPHGLIGLPEDGVTGADYRVGGGNGCMLMKRRVFKQWHPAYLPLRFYNDVKNLGSDLWFWYRAQEIGLTCRIHWYVLCGHLPEWPLNCYKEDYKTKFGMDLDE